MAAAEFERVSAGAAAGAVAPIASPAGAGDRAAASIEDPPPRTPASEGRPAAPDRELARLAGTVVHAALEGWDFTNGAALRDSARQGAKRAVLETMTRSGGDPDRARRLDDEVQAIVRSFLASPLPARLSRVEILGRELPILFRDPAGVAWSGACDLLYRERDGNLVVADYKTDRVLGDPREFAQRYRPQIAVYAEAVRRSFPGKGVRGEVLFIRSGTAVPFTFEGLTPQEPSR
jgi:ATP-dependent exoDNAse (exonuclease V) beta subunit